MKVSRSEKIFAIFNYTIMGLISLSMILPILYILQLTLSGHPDQSFRIFPRNFTLNNYIFIFKRGIIVKPLLNSLFLSISSTAFSLLMTSILAYPLSNKSLPGRRFFNFLVVFTMMINLGFLPKYLLVRELGLMNTFLSVIFVVGINSFNLIIMRNYLQTIPIELIDSARIDGARESTILLKIVLPLSLPVIATISLFYFVDIWNEYFQIILYINDSSKQTLQVLLRSVIILQEEMGTSGSQAMLMDNMKYTTVIVALIPIIILYPFLQKYFAKGILLGSVKG